MIVTRTPLRVSFLGGGTDLGSYYAHADSPGAVYSAAIDKYVYVVVNKKFDDKIRVSYSETEIVDNLDRIKHERVRECLRALNITHGIEIVSVADVPSNGTGLGASSAFTVGLLRALHILRRDPISSIHPGKLAAEACHIEIEACGAPIGKQDQYASAYGGFNEFFFHRNEDVTVRPCDPRRDVENFMLFYTGTGRSADKILLKQSDITPSDPRFQTLRSMAKMVSERGSYENFGVALRNAWELKQSLGCGITDKSIDALMTTAYNAGAVGGKLLGAGGGGFLLLYVPVMWQENVKKALNMTPTEFSFTTTGSTTVFNDATI